MTSSATKESPSRQQAWKMFDRIAHRYDLLNRLLSFGTDVRWRKRLAKLLPQGDKLRVLDLATGTCDVLLTLHKECARMESGVGVDMSGEMLVYGQKKIQQRGLTDTFKLARGDATQLAIASEAFDAVTISFGIRNTIDVPQALREMHRILKPEGRALILEFSLPGNPLFRAFYLFYFRHVLPKLGGLVSGDWYAYKYLNETVETFPYGEAFCSLMREAGFNDVRAYPLTMGIATIYQGDK